MSAQVVFSPMSWLTGGTVKTVFRDACRRYELVYFGTVSQYHDDHEMVRGVTLSPSHTDQHYCVGSVQNRDVILLYRTDKLSFPSKPTKVFRWYILQVDLSGVNLPHVLLDAHHRDETFYAQLFAKFARLTKAHQGVFEGHDPKFSQRYTAYTPPDAIDLLPRLLPLATTEVIGHSLHEFDYEFYQDRLLVYALDRPATKQLIDHMIKAGLWLAAELEKNAQVAGAVATPSDSQIV